MANWLSYDKKSVKVFYHSWAPMRGPSFELGTLSTRIAYRAGALPTAAAATARTDRHATRLTTNQPASQPKWQYPAESWELVCCSSVYFLKTNISQGSVATCFRCGGIFNDHLIANLLLNVKKFWKSVNISWRYGTKSVWFFWACCDMWYRYLLHDSTTCSNISIQPTYIFLVHNWWHTANIARMLCLHVLHLNVAQTSRINAPLKYAINVVFRGISSLCNS